MNMDSLSFCSISTLHLRMGGDKVLHFPFSGLLKELEVIRKRLDVGSVPLEAKAETYKYTVSVLCTTRDDCHVLVCFLPNDQHMTAHTRTNEHFCAQLALVVVRRCV